MLTTEFASRQSRGDNQSESKQECMMSKRASRVMEADSAGMHLAERRAGWRSSLPLGIGGV